MAEGDVALIIVLVGHAAVVHVGNGEHPVGQEREFEQSVEPVAVVLVGGEVLQLSAQGELAVYAVFRVGHEYVGMYHAAVPLNYRLVVKLVHVHKVQAEGARERLFYLYVEVLIVGFVAPLEEGRAVAVGACERPVVRVYGAVLAVDGVYVREVHLYVHAVFASDGGVALEAVAQFGLIRPLAVGLRGIRVERGKGVGMLHGEGRQVVYGRGYAAGFATLAPELHRVAALGLQQQAETAVRI